MDRLARMAGLPSDPDDCQLRHGTLREVARVARRAVVRRGDTARAMSAASQALHGEPAALDAAPGHSPGGPVRARAARGGAAARLRVIGPS